MSATRPLKVCVLGEEERAFLSVVRSFGRRGAEVHCAWTSTRSLARASRYVTRIHDDVLPYVSGDDAWIASFVAMLQRERFDLVIPTNDASVVPLQEHRAALEPHGRLYLLSDRAYEVTFDKAKTHALATELGVRVPRQGEARAGEPLGVDASWFPVVVKARASLAAGSTTRRAGVRVAATPAELAEALRDAGSAPVLVQEFIPGAGVGIEVLAHDGRVLTALQHARVHELDRNGADSYRATEPVDAAMGAAVRTLVEALEYTGVGMFEFRRDRATGAWALIEINGRFWGSLPLCLKAGADFPYWLYEMIVEGRREFPSTYAVGVACRNWTRDLQWLRQELADPVRRRALPGRLVPELRALLTGREASDTLVLDDLRPGIEEVRRLGERGARWLARQVRDRVDRTPTVRRRRAVRTRAAIASARHVLFVCKGNICRSPFAECYLRAQGGSPTVTSAGYYPKADRQAPGEAQQAARDFGIDLGGHRSRVLDAEALRAADCVVTFDRENYETVLRDFPFARPKLQRLALLRADGAMEIADPYGGTVDDFRQTYRVIAAALDAARD